MKTSFALSMVLAVTLSSAAADKPRVYVTDSKSWKVSGGVGGMQDAFGGGSKTGKHPQATEIIKTFGHRCPGVIVNNKQEKADYVILLDHEGSLDLIAHDNKVVVMKRNGNSILSHSTRSLGNAVKDACIAIAADWPKQATKTNMNFSSDPPTIVTKNIQ